MFFSRISSTNLVWEDENLSPDPEGFNDPLQEYLYILKQAQQLIDENDTAHAKTLLATLLVKIPHHPELYVALGDVFKIDNHNLAIKYYSKAVELCPFDYFTHTKLALMGRGDLKESFKMERFFEKKQADFVKKHQQALRTHLSGLGKIDVREFDRLLSNGLAGPSSKDSFYGLTAKVNGLLPLAQYYFKKAYTLFEHDYLAKTEFAFIHMELNNPEESIIELNNIAEEYHYCGANLYLFKIYRSLMNYSLARRNLVSFISLAQRGELEELNESRDEMTEFLQYNVFDENEVKKYKVPKRYDLKAVMSSPTRLGVSFAEMLKQLITSDNPLIIEEINLKILQYPRLASLYNVRAKYYQHKGLIFESVLDYSMAVWHSTKEACIEYYLSRCTAHLVYGNSIQAEFDFVNLKRIAEETVQTSKTELILQLSRDVSLACHQVGLEYLSQKKYVISANVFRLGIKIRPSLNMYLDCSKAMKRGGRPSTEIIELLEHATKKIILKGNDLKKYNGVYNHFINLNQRETAERVSYLETYDDMMDDIPALGQEQNSETNLTYILLSIVMLTATAILALFVYKRFLRSRMMVQSSAATSDSNAKSRQLKKKITKSRSLLPTPSCPPRKNNTTSHIKHLLSAPVEEQISDDFDAAAEQQRKNNLQQVKKQARKQKEKEKKREIKSQRRTSRSSRVSNSSESEVSESDNDKPTIVSSSGNDDLQVELNDFENKIFNLLTNSVPESERAKYKTYLVGGWAYDKVRQKILGIAPCTYNDADYVTEIPTEILAQNFSPIPEVPGLFCARIDDVKIDIVHEPDLSNLLRDAKGRDFLTLYINAGGKVSDPTGFALINLRTKHLSGVYAPADMFKEDALIILRAIYLATKRDLKINSLRKIIKTDRHLLIPGATNSNLPEERLFNPRRFNLRFAKLFSQKLATRNLELLNNFGILEVLFPHIYPDLLTNFNWLRAQISVTNAYVWPKIAIIYANFIACALVMRMPESELAYLPSQMKFHPLLQATVHHIWNSSYLFQDTFIDPDNLYSFLKRPLQEWRNYLESSPVPALSLSMSSSMI